MFDIANARVGLPTCYDQWFPEVSRALALNGADVIVYPSAIGSEPDHPAFDTEPIWEQVIRAQGVMSGTFMVVINRIGTEGPNTFYGSSFVSDPYGRCPRASAARRAVRADRGSRSRYAARLARSVSDVRGAPAGNVLMPIAEQIDCMECGGTAYLAQPIGPDDEIEVDDVLTYLCGDCNQRWDVVVDEADLTDE